MLPGDGGQQPVPRRTWHVFRLVQHHFAVLDSTISRWYRQQTWRLQISVACPMRVSCNHPLLRKTAHPSTVISYFEKRRQFLFNQIKNMFFLLTADREAAPILSGDLAKTCATSTKFRKCVQNWRQRCPGIRFPWGACISNMSLYGGWVLSSKTQSAPVTKFCIRYSCWLHSRGHT